MTLKLSRKSIFTTLLGFLLISNLFLSGFSPASAQVVPRFQSSDITMDINPVNPDAFEDVTITLQTFSIDLDIYHITWIVDSEEHSVGFGKKSITVPVGSYGEPTRIEAIIRDKDGRLVKKTVALRPATVDILWEAVDAYVPPFYKGKALPAREAVLKITAMPNLVIDDVHLQPQELDYTWRWNYRVKDTSSGFNKQFMAIKNLFINREEVIEVNVQNNTGTVRGEGRTKITFFEPEVLFYETFPTTNQYNLGSARKNITTNSSTPVTFNAAPYFFSIPPKRTLDFLEYEWVANDTLIAEGVRKNKNRITVAPSGQGTTNVNVEITGPQQNFQNVSESLTITTR